MTPNEFQVQMNRLVETYGKPSYGTERARLLWLEVKDFDARWFARVVDRFIGDSRQAPMLSDFRAAAESERSRKSSRHEEAALDLVESSLRPEDVHSVMEVITRRIQGRASDAEFEALKKFLSANASGNPSPVCQQCDGIGHRFVSDGKYESAIHCECRRAINQSWAANEKRGGS